ncbi:adenine nucleotide alpha hydrolases-like protein [Cristinia sonorae]|uniref:tRNA(Ile)-lysidine synthetase n=1 Tax=Cristinia sonorae TaxID=1940300 RepID=A0A8K0ULG7_9AGAR|nr:adenine nucleotide alpha hydrolases-like protein [Cristinia sonorae]
MSQILAISIGEFLQYLQKCIPPGGWRGKLGISLKFVANSGGPDSVCLLFLLASILRQRNVNGLPSSILSVHVDHSLQAASTRMAEQAAESAHRLDVPHVKTKIPWSQPPFPPNPAQSASLERICRDARQNRLAHAMTTANASTIAFAHHADDQVETSIMRLSKGSSMVGASGMRPIRRWGMGDSQDEPLTWMGEEGMDKFIVRPLLEVSKDRILATCEANNLSYATDPTNFQPDITLRNYLRDRIKNFPLDVTVNPKGLGPSIPFMDQVEATEEAIKTLRAVSPGTTGLPQLRNAVHLIGQKVQKLETQVTYFLKRNLIPSPPTTLLLPLDALKELEDETSIAFVRRVLRYVSPYPWGHISAEAEGRYLVHHRILLKLRESLTPRSPTPKAFSMGAMVWWRPVYMSATCMGFNKRNPPLQLAWMAQRATPYNPGSPLPDWWNPPLERDITSQFTEAFSSRTTCKILYDCRVLVELDMAHCPLGIAEVLQSGTGSTIHLLPSTQFHLPQVLLRRPGKPDNILASYPWPDENVWRMWNRKKSPINCPSWIRMSTVRTWDPW